MEEGSLPSRRTNNTRGPKAGVVSVLQKRDFLKVRSLHSVQNKINSKLKTLQEKIDLVLSSNINFDKKGWNVKVASILGIVPQAVKQWMVREMPEFYKNCWHHDDNKMAS